MEEAKLDDMTLDTPNKPQKLVNRVVDIFGDCRNQGLRTAK